MLKTVLIITFLSTAAPQIPARLVHQAFNSPVACMKAMTTIQQETVVPDDIRASYFCVPLADLELETQQ